jgi:hypothetical protein
LCDGGDALWGCHEGVPSLATGLDDVLVGLIKPVGELVLAQILPHVLGGVELRRVGRKRDGGDVGRDREFPAAMPAGTIVDEHRMRAGRDGFGDFLKVLVHGFGVGVRHDDGRTRRALRADRTEKIGPFVTGIANRAGSGALACPKPGQRALLAHTGLVLKPDLDGLAPGMLRQALA